MSGADEIPMYEAMLEKHLDFYEGLRTRTRRPRSAAQRQFQDVAWGKAEAVTDHERAYVYYLKKRGYFRDAVIPVQLETGDGGIERYPVGHRPISFDTARKWDEEWVDTPGSGPRRR